MAPITVINPLGTGFVLSAMTDGIALDQRKKLARKIVINCIGIFLVVLVFGSYILNFFGLNISINRVGSGLLLAFMGWTMLNAPDATDTASVNAVDPDSYFKNAFYPFTFPVLSGPGCIAVIFTLEFTMAPVKNFTYKSPGYREPSSGLLAWQSWSTSVMCILSSSRKAGPRRRSRFEPHHGVRDTVYWPANSLGRNSGAGKDIVRSVAGSIFPWENAEGSRKTGGSGSPRTRRGRVRIHANVEGLRSREGTGDGALNRAAGQRGRLAATAAVAVTVSEIGSMAEQAIDSYPARINRRVSVYRE